MLNDVEVEVVLLKAVWELIDTAANFSIFRIVGEDPESEIRFLTSTHRQFFNIVLADLLSKTDKLAPLRQTTYPNGMRAITDKPLLSTAHPATGLSNAVTDFM